MPELNFTNHFIDNWRARVGGDPVSSTVQAIIRRSVRIQKSIYVKKPGGEPYRILAIYWHPDLDLIIKIDPVDRAAISVMSRENWRYDGKPLATDKPEPLNGARVPKPRAEGRREVIAIKRMKSREMTERALRISETFCERKGVAR